MEAAQFEFDEDDDVAIADVTIEYVTVSITYRASTITPTEFENSASAELPPHEELYLQNIMRKNPFEVVF